MTAGAHDRMREGSSTTPMTTVPATSPATTPAAPVSSGDARMGVAVDDVARRVAGGDLSTDQARSLIRTEISDTRHRMSGTLDELAVRLSPTRFKRQLTNDIRDATIGRVETMARDARGRVNDTRASIIDTIRENPIPAAMAAVGIGWLFMNRSDSGARREQRFLADRSRSANREEWAAQHRSDYDSASLAAGDRHEGYGEFDRGEYWHEADASSERQGQVERVRERAHHVSDAARERMHETGERAREVTSRARESTRNLASRTRERTMSVGRATRDRAVRAERRVEDAYRENPLALGAAALALGFVAGISAPRTRRETEWMGERRDTFVDRVKHELEDVKEKAQHVGSRVLEESKEVAKEAAREEGLHA